jgi:dienelactone hydrolase
MTIKSTLAGLALIAFPALAMAQIAAAPRTIAPLVISDETIGILRQHQVGAIILPRSKPPFPAVVVLHGCNGVSQNTWVWARRLASWGYAALVINSFSPRGLSQVCDEGRELPGPRRARDAFAAAAYLRSRPDIDGKRIGLVGYSHGGWTALAASWTKSARRAKALPFQVAVAFYPYCPKVTPALATDLLILIGDADDWASAKLCTAYVDKYGTDAAHRPSLKIYPGARHSFDAKRPERVYFGHRLAYDAKATADAVERTRKFLAENLNARP